MAFDGTADFDAMLAEVGVPVALIHNGEEQTGFGLLDTRDEDLVSAGGGGFAGKVIALILRKARWRGLTEGATITVDSAAYTILGTRQFDTGDAVRVTLART